MLWTAVGLMPWTGPHVDVRASTARVFSSICAADSGNPSDLNSLF